MACMFKIGGVAELRHTALYRIAVMFFSNIRLSLIILGSTKAVNHVRKDTDCIWQETMADRWRSVLSSQFNTLRRGIRFVYCYSMII